MSEQHPYDPQRPYEAYGPPSPGAAGPSYGFGPTRDHPRAVVVLIVGILSFAFCQLLGPVAWSMGGSVRREIAASGGQLGGGQAATVGWVLGIVSTVLVGLGLLVVVGAFVLIALAGSTSP